MQIIKLNLATLQSWGQGEKIAPPKLQEIEAALERALTVLRAGALLVYPTETVYGIGVDAENPLAVAKLLTYKGRREGKPLSIAVANQKIAAKYVQINEQAQAFYDKFLPGPYTVISAAKGAVAPGVESEFGSLGVRIPDFPLILRLLEKFGKAITSTSANASGKKRPYAIADLLDNLSQRQKQLIDLIIDVGQLPPNEPSTVIDTTLSTPLTLRGMERIAGKKERPGQVFYSQDEEETMSLAGRLLLKHWSTLEKKPLIFALNGELGVGKTIFAKGLAKFLQIKDTISSPTYSYMNEYPYQHQNRQGMLYHLDAWKIDNRQQWQLLEVEKLLQPNNILVVEWWQQVADFLPAAVKQPTIVLNFSYAKKADDNKIDKKRKIEIIK